MISVLMMLLLRIIIYFVAMFHEQCCLCMLSNYLYVRFVFQRVYMYNFTLNCILQTRLLNLYCILIDLFVTCQCCMLFGSVN